MNTPLRIGLWFFVPGLAGWPPPRGGGVWFRVILPPMASIELAPRRKCCQPKRRFAGGSPCSICR